MANELFDRRGNFEIVTHQDKSDEARFVIASEMECDAVIRENRQLREAATGKEQFRLVARFPAPIVEQALQQGWYHDDDKWGKLINDPQYRDFRVAEGRY